MSSILTLACDNGAICGSASNNLAVCTCELADSGDCIGTGHYCICAEGAEAVTLNNSQTFTYGPNPWQQTPMQINLTTVCLDGCTAREYKDEPCWANSGCDTSSGNATCVCNEEFMIDPNNTQACIPEDPCTKIDPYTCTDIDNSACINLNGIGQCQCDQNFELYNQSSGVWSALSDVLYFDNNDPNKKCVSGTPCIGNTDCDAAENKECIVQPDETGLPASHCQCVSGWESSDNNTSTVLASNAADLTCVDIDECSRPDLDTCVFPEVCDNKNGTFDCICGDGYLANSTSACIECDGPGAFLELELCACGADNSTINGDGNQCLCQSGFNVSTDGQTCEDIDECDTGDHNCDSISQICVNNDGSFECNCATNFTLDDTDSLCKRDCEAGSIRHSNNYECVECDGPGAILNNNTCTCSASNSTLNGDGNMCSCDTGYEENGASCDDVDECSTGDDDCNDVSESCVNNDGSFSCNCAPNFTRDVNDDICKIDCAEGSLRHSNNTHCVDCSGPGAILDSDVCSCPADNSLLNTESDACDCESGYTTSTDGNFCEDIDECAENLANCTVTSEVCNNNNGSYTCDCAVDFTRDTDDLCKRDCTNGTLLHSNNLECVACSGPGSGLESDQCSCSASNSTLNGDACECDAGYQLSDDEQSCEDVDECQENSDDCNAESEECVNNDGSFSCDCATGFSRDGTDDICKKDCLDGELLHSNNTHCVSCSGPGSLLTNDVCSCTNDANAGINSDGDGCICGAHFKSNANNTACIPETCDDIDCSMIQDSECGIDSSNNYAKCKCSNTTAPYTRASAGDDWADSGSIFFDSNDADLSACFDSTPCEVDSCLTNQHCIKGETDDKEPIAVCKCNVGYADENALESPAENNTLTCSDIDECDTGNNTCLVDSQTCTDTEGSYECNCADGFLSNEDATTKLATPCIECSGPGSSAASGACACDSTVNSELRIGLIIRKIYCIRHLRLLIHFKILTRFSLLSHFP